MKSRDNSNLVPFLIPLLRPLLFISGGLSLLLIPRFSGKNLEEVSLYWPLVCIIINIVTITILKIVISKDGLKYRDLIMHNHIPEGMTKKLLTAIPLMLILGIGGLVGISVMVYGYMPVISSQPLPVWAAIIVLLLLPSTIVFAEIPLYVGFSSPGLKKATNSELFSIAYPLFFYALQHSFMPLLFDFQHIISRFLMFIPLLVFIGIWYSRGKGLLPLIIGHGILDIMTAIQILIVSLDPSIYELMNSIELN